MQSLAFAPAKCQKAQTLQTVIAASPELPEWSIFHDTAHIHQHPSSFPDGLSENINNRRAEAIPKTNYIVLVCCSTDYNKVASKR